MDALDTVGLLNSRRYEQTDSSLTFAGLWTAGSDVNMSGGSYKYSNAPGSAFNVAFTGTRVDWITSKSSVNGIARVSLDGGAPIDVDLYSPTYAVKQVAWTSGPIADGAHTLRIEYTGSRNASSTGTFIGLDALDVVGVTTVLRHDDADARLAYEGAWTRHSDANMAAGGYQYASSAGQAVNVAFTGTRLDWITSVSTNNGIARVILDGSAPVEVDLYSPTFKYKQTVWSTGQISDGPHTLRIEYTGSKNASSTNTFVGLDALDLYGVLTTASAGPLPITVEETSSALAFTGKWHNNTDPRMSGGAYTYSKTTSSTVSVSFTGTQLDIVGPRNLNYGIIEVVLDGQLLPPVDLYSPTYLGRAIVFTTGELSAGSHTATVTVTGTRNPKSTGDYFGLDAFIIKGTLP